MYALIFIICIWMLTPVYFIFSMAFTTPEVVHSYPKSFLPFIPFSTDTMRFFLGVPGVIPGLVNSVIVATTTTILSTTLAIPAGYAISRFLFLGRNFFRLSILGMLAFPLVVVSIPMAVTFIQLGLFDTVFSLALMHTAMTLPINVLIVSSVFAGVPYELEEAGQVLGCSPMQSFRHVIIPLAIPGIAASCLFTFAMSWNEVFAASILTLQNRTLPITLALALGGSDAYKFAGAFILLLPALIFMFFMRNYLFNMWGRLSN